MTKEAGTHFVPWCLLWTAALAVGCIGPSLSAAPTSGANGASGKADGAPGVDLPYSSKVPERLPRSTTLIEAESGETTGSVSEVSTKLHTPGAEASGRRYVTLAPGQSVTWRPVVVADSLVLRYSYPDAPEGGGLDGTLNVQIGGATVGTLAVTSRYSWDYGRPAWGSANVWPSAPSAGSPRHFWDEASLRLAAGIDGRKTIGITNPRDSGRTVLIDLIELELVPPAVLAPLNSLSLADYHPAADGIRDDSPVVLAALADAAKQNKILYVPEGTYQIGTIDIDEAATLQGAGMWRTRFVGKAAQFRFLGSVARISDIAVFGEAMLRDDMSGDRDNAFGGTPDENSVIERVWVEHMKCAYVAASPTRLRITGCRFRNLMADGVNLYDAAAEMTLDNNQIRNSGDDAIAIWGGHHDTVAYNLVELPRLANGIGLFGGGPFRVIGNTVRDTVTTGAAINVDGEKPLAPFVGLVQVEDNDIIRGGAHESDSGGPTGAIRVLAGSTDMTSGRFVFTNNRVVSPLESAVSIQGPHRIANLIFSGLDVADAAWAADVRPNAVGEATFENVTVRGSRPLGWRNRAGGSFKLVHP